ncbi:DUF4382 domain-containing protein [Aquabacterium sp.]|uniref:DUF4382 domain-containing protein n=1 Tax=Aquabacterium sp. TaxID=1872578 RepID=UPI0035B009F7
MVKLFRAVGSGWRVLAGLVAGVSVAVFLSGCGGGGGGSSSSSSGSSSTGSLTVRLTGGSSAGFTHFYVTLRAMAFNADASKPWDANDSTWKVVNFSSPIQVDLAQLIIGSASPFQTLLSGQSVPVGTYLQMRLFPASSDGQAVDANGATTPVEWPDALLGVRVPASFTISKNASTQLYLQWDIAHSLVPLASGGALTLRPNLATVDVSSSSGAIKGYLDAAQFCPGSSRSGCISDVEITAQSLSPDSTRHVVVWSTQPSGAATAQCSTCVQFMLFPLPPGNTFDVVIRGRNMKPIVVKSVMVSALDLLASSGTRLNPAGGNSTTSATIVPTLVADESPVSLSVSPGASGDASLWIGQTPVGSAPYEWASAAADPISGQFPLSSYLPSEAVISVATYRDSSTTLSFSDEALSETGSSYKMKAYGTSYDVSSALQTVAPPSAASAASPDPNVSFNGSINVTLTAPSSTTFNRAWLVVSDVNGVVYTRDVSSYLTASGSLPLPGLARGAYAADQLGGGTAVYGVSIRCWNTASSQPAQWVRATSAVDLRSATSGSVSLTLP